MWSFSPCSDADDDCRSSSTLTSRSALQQSPKASDAEPADGTGNDGDDGRRRGVPKSQSVDGDGAKPAKRGKDAGRSAKKSRGPQKSPSLCSDSRDSGLKAATNPSNGEPAKAAKKSRPSSKSAKPRESEGEVAARRERTSRGRDGKAHKERGENDGGRGSKKPKSKLSKSGSGDVVRGPEPEEEVDPAAFPPQLVQNRHPPSATRRNRDPSGGSD